MSQQSPVLASLGGAPWQFSAPAVTHVPTENLSDLTSKLLQMRDEEQRRLARELHDSVGQLLAAMSMNLSILARERALSKLAERAMAENAALLAQISSEIRTISHLLHPPLLDEIGLASGLRLYLEGFAERSHMRVDLELANDFGRLSRDMETALFRIVQECMTNVHRHSKSATAAIRLTRSAVEVCLEVADAGKGISQEKILEIQSGKTYGVGLRGMRERIRQLGGRLEIRSSCKGTIVAVQLPMEQLFGEVETRAA